MANYEKKSFVMYYNFANQFHMLSMQQRGLLITAIFEYAERGTVTNELKGKTALAFSFIKDVLDRDKAEYAAVCERNALNGKKGGRPRKENPQKTKKPDNDNGIDNDTDTENDIDNDNDTGNDNDTEPCENPAPHPNAPLTREEKNKLISLGVPSEYIEKRRARASDYGKAKGKSTYDVLLSWWKQDGDIKPVTPKNWWDDDEFFKLKCAAHFGNVNTE